MLHCASLFLNSRGGYFTRCCPAWFEQPELSSILLFNLGHLLSSLTEAAVQLRIIMLDAIGTCAFSDQPAGEEAAKPGNTITWGASDKEGCLFGWIPHLLVCMQDSSSWANAANFTSGQINGKRFNPLQGTHWNTWKFKTYSVIGEYCRTTCRLRIFCGWTRREKLFW